MRENEFGEEGTRLEQLLGLFIVWYLMQLSVSRLLCQARSEVEHRSGRDRRV